MAELVGIGGFSGAGKSTSLRTLPPDVSKIISVTKRSLPFKGWKRDWHIYGESKSGNMVCNNMLPGKVGVSKDPLDFEGLREWLDAFNARPEIKYIAIDDFTHLFSGFYFDTIEIKGWDKYNQVGSEVWSLLRHFIPNMRADLTIICLCHLESVDVGDQGAKREKVYTIGNATDKYINLESLFRIFLYCNVNTLEEDVTKRYTFDTQGSKYNTCKAPMGMFSTRYIPNDLGKFLKIMHDYDEGVESAVTVSQ